MKKVPQHIRDFQGKVDAHRQNTRVYAKYHAAYDNTLYHAATNGKSSEYANRLIDFALALCGDSFYSMPTNPRLSAEAIAFLEKFLEPARDL